MSHANIQIRQTVLQLPWLVDMEKMAPFCCLTTILYIPFFDYHFNKLLNDIKQVYDESNNLEKLFNNQLTKAIIQGLINEFNEFYELLESPTASEQLEKLGDHDHVLIYIEYSKPLVRPLCTGKSF
jgi:hypothetical protein